ncbi:MAG: right-handed parallel beta-helix repeat-containing protein [bacterium]|nr:right-handed parallel beta-helix repeat-containing protein [bacterium]
MLLIFAGCQSSNHYQDGFAGLKQLHINPGHPLADDSNPGNETSPLKTIQAGYKLALQNRSNSLGTRVWLHPAVYREAIQGGASGGGPPIVFQAVVPGTAVISGADLWNTGWTTDPGTNLEVNTWSHDWGVEANPWVKHKITITPLGRRREMLIVNGINLEQKLSLTETISSPGSFYVEESSDTIYVNPLEGPLANAQVEVAVRPTLVKCQGVSDLALKGIVFMHANSILPFSAVEIVEQDNIYVEDCRFEWNNWQGLSFWNTKGVTVRRSTATHNGGDGMEGSQVQGALFEECETSYNGWRAKKGGLNSWAIGQKFTRARNLTFCRHRSFGNETRGLWLDSDCSDIVIKDSYFANNGREGICLEACQGPTLISGCLITENQGGGLVTSNTHGLTLQNCVFDGNWSEVEGESAQVTIAGVDTRCFRDFVSGIPIVLGNDDWTWVENKMVGRNAAQAVIRSLFIPTNFNSERNTYWNPADDKVFHMRKKAPMTFGTWVIESNVDATSEFKLPMN